MTLKIPHIIIFTTLLLTACSSNQSSPERHARHAMYQLAQVHLNPNTRAPQS